MPPDPLGLDAAGTRQLGCRTVDGRPVRRFGAGESFGGIGALAWGRGSGYARCAHVVAVAPLRLVVCADGALNVLMRGMPSVRARILEALVAFRGLRLVDRRARMPVVELNLLREMPVFAGLPAPQLEDVARSLQPLHVAAGEVLIRRGDRGDRYYAIAGGKLDVVVDGVAARRLGRGEGAGEIALLRDVPRTATVVAQTDADVYALDKAPFVAAVIAHAPMERVLDARLARLPVRTAMEETT